MGHTDGSHQKAVPVGQGHTQNLFVPQPGRQACVGFGGDVNEGAVAYSNVMNYGSEDEKLTFTSDQRSSVRNTLELYDTYKPLIERPAPIDCNNRAGSIRDDGCERWRLLKEHTLEVSWYGNIQSTQSFLLSLPHLNRFPKSLSPL